MRTPESMLNRGRQFAGQFRDDWSVDSRRGRRERMKKKMPAAQDLSSPATGPHATRHRATKIVAALLAD